MLCENIKEQIDLVLTDVMMPNGSGRQLAERIRELRPGTKVAFMSGFAKDAALRDGRINGAAHFIPKPFSPAELASGVRAVLDR